jgi:putative transposase
LPTENEAKLFELAEATKELVLKEFQRRSKMNEETGKIDTSIMPAYRNPEYFSFKRILGSANYDEVLRFVSEQYRSFSELLEMKNRGELPEDMDPKPPRRFKPLAVFVRYDNYTVDAKNKIIKLKYYNLELRFKGELRWWNEKVKQGGLMLIFNEVKKRWYAHISSYIVINRDTNSGYKCGIDLGQKILATVATENGHVFMYKGSKLAWDYQYYKKRLSMNDKLFDLGEIDRDVWLARVHVLNYKRRKHVDEAFKNLASHLVKNLKQLGVNEIYVGYPHNIAKDRPTESNVNFWSYRKLMTRIALTAENYGIAIYAVDESNTSQYCACHGIKGQRSPRGLLHCPMGHIIHSDINAALNILKKQEENCQTASKYRAS